ncbi:MAG: SRPBCC domain-containing protein [Phycisphaeraceae bacterium]|nr:SRPBCC domain-containing protein [Phycisphaeraceae bacterium]
MAASVRIHGQDAQHGCAGRRELQDVVHELWDGQQSRVRRDVHGLTPHERIRYTDKFDDPNLPGEMQVTVRLKKVICGTEVEIVQTGIPAMIPVEMCHLGWQESLVQLAHVVEPEIPDGG